MKEKLIEQIESRISTLETEATAAVVSVYEMKKNIREVSKFIKSSIDFAKSTGDEFSEQEINDFNSRIKKLREPYSISTVSPKSFDISKKTKKIAIRLASVAVAGGILTGCGYYISNSSEKSQDTQVAAVSTVTDLELDIPEVEIEEIMSEKITAFSDTTVYSIEDALAAGINLSLNDELTDSDKETYARILTQYRIVANIDDFTNLEYAELFGEASDPTEDLVTSFFKFNSELSYQLTRVNSNTTIDYNNLYNNTKDAEVLNESQRLIVNINEATTKKDR